MRSLLPLPWMFVASVLSAQGTPSPSLAADVGLAIPVGQFARDGAQVGRSVGVSATMRFTRHLGVYGSYEQAAFGLESTTRARGDGTWTDTGLGLGGRLWLPLRDDSRMHPWLQLGLGWHDLDAPIAGQEYAVLDTKGLRTLEGGAGIDIALDRRRVLFLRPMARYRRYDFEVTSSGGTARSRIAYVTLNIGLVVARGPGVPRDSSARTR